MDQGLIPKRYAKAVYEVALERKQDTAMYFAMLTLEQSFVAEPRLQATLTNPFVSDADKDSLLREAAGKPEESTFADMLRLLGENHRLDIARDIALAYIAIYRNANHIYKVNIVSAAPLDKENRKRIDSIVAQETGPGTLEYSYSVDPSLVGGFKVSVGNKEIDASVKARLDALKRHLMAN